MQTSTVAVGSLDALGAVLEMPGVLELAAGADVVIVPTAAAFTGVAAAAVATAAVFDGVDVRLEALMVTDRSSSSEDYFAQRIAVADLVVLCDGSPLHARTVWRQSPVGDAINESAHVVAVGSVATVLGDVMIDPRGGAPTTGLGYRSGVTFGSPSSEEQLARTRSLLTPDDVLVVLGPRGVLVRDEQGWRVVCGDDVVTTKGSDVVTL